MTTPEQERWICETCGRRFKADYRVRPGEPMAYAYYNAHIKNCPNPESLGPIGQTLCAGIGVPYWGGFLLLMILVVASFLVSI
jgi:hypothetical protein